MSALAPTVEELTARNLEKLPSVAYAVLDDNPRGARIVMITAGHLGAGVTLYDDPCEELEQVHKYVNKLNARLGISPQQALAMLAGALHGFHVAGADPDTYKTH